MERATKTIKLSDCEVDIVTYVTWGEKEDIQAVIMSGANVGGEGLAGFNTKAVRESKYKALEICIKGIRTGGETAEFSREWMDSLPLDDGNVLYEAVDDVSNPKKK